jgi:hypothetical protein
MAKLLYDDLILDVVVAAGVPVVKALDQMITLRRRLAINVRTVFNGVSIFVCRDDQTIESLHQEYQESLGAVTEAQTEARKKEIKAGREMTLEEVVIHIWDMALASVRPGVMPYDANVVRQNTLFWATFELNERIQLAMEAGMKKVADLANNFAGIKHNPEWKAKLKELGIGGKR